MEPYCVLWFENYISVAMWFARWKRLGNPDIRQSLLSYIVNIEIPDETIEIENSILWEYPNQY